ncbi:hypothetical protein RE0327_47950 (plasmid) [Prescottella equi]|nr:hypothetical protein RE0327_47950 [Prescottella equi]
MGHRQRTLLADTDLLREAIMGLDYGFFGRGPLGPLGHAIDTALYWIITGGHMPPTYRSDPTDP